MNFTVYTKTGCPYCHQIVKVLQVAELKHVVYNLGRDFTKEEFYSEFGKGSTFPQVIMNDVKLGGCTESIKYMKENNIL